MAIDPGDTTESLTPRLAELGGQLAVEVIPRFAAGEVTPQPQPQGGSLTRPLVKADGWLDWNAPAAELEHRVRAMWPWPRAWTTLGDQPLQVHAASVLPGVAREPGSVATVRGDIAVGTGDGVLVLDTVQLPGGRPTPGRALLDGRRVSPGEPLGRQAAPVPVPPLVMPVGDG